MHRPEKTKFVVIYSSSVVSSVSLGASSSSDVSSSSLSEDLKLEGAEILAITKSRSIVGFAPSGSVTDEMEITSPISRPVRSTVIFSGISAAVTRSSTSGRTTV